MPNSFQQQSTNKCEEKLANIKREKSKKIYKNVENEYN